MNIKYQITIRLEHWFQRSIDLRKSHATGRAITEVLLLEEIVEHTLNVIIEIYMMPFLIAILRYTTLVVQFSGVDYDSHICT